MNKIQKLLALTKKNLYFYLALILIIIFSYIFLSPKISSQLFAFKRHAILNEFINNTKANGVNSQQYWKFREFYSPGYFIFSRNGIEEKLLKSTQEKVGIKYDEEKIDLTFLTFSSSKTNSLDMLTRQTDLSLIMNKQELSKANVIFMNKNSLIYKEDPGVIKMVFLINNAEMKKANGFFKYNENDKKITEGENWLSVTSLKTN